MVRRQHLNCIMTETKSLSKMTRLVFLFFFLLSGFSSLAQTPEDFEFYQKKYPHTQMVVLNELEEVHISLNNEELEIYETSYTKILYLTKDAGLYREREIGFSSFSSISEISAITSIPNGSKFKKLKTKEFKESDDMNSSVFHDDAKIISFSFQGMQKGAISELSYKRTIHEPRFLGRSMLQNSFPIEKKIYRVIVDKEVEMEFTKYHTNQEFITYTQTEEKGKTVYTWTVKNSPVLVSEKWSPNITYYVPQVFPRVATYGSEGNKKNLLRNVDDLFAWYETFVDTVNLDTDNEMIQAIVDSVTAGATTDLEKVGRVFDWTQENIKYVAYEAGLGGFVPRPAVSVCTNRYGDCKDMAGTIVHLLKYAGITAHLTWIGTNTIPFTYEQLPTPSVDNHMIATYIDTDGKHYFMDATGRYSPFGLPSSFIQEQEALIRISPGKYEIYKVPAVSPMENATTDHIKASIVDNTFSGSATSTFSGYFKQNIQYKLEDLSETEKAKFFKGYLRKGNNKFLPTEFEESHSYPDPEPYTVNYDFTIGDYLLFNEDEIYINFHLSDFYSGDKLKEDRKTPFFFKFIAQHKEVTEFTIPENFSLDYMPEEFTVDNEIFYYQCKYSLNGNILTVKTNSYKKKLYYSTDDVPLWNKSINSIIKSQKNVVILKKNN